MTRDKKKPDEKFTYKSLFTGEYILAHQWIAEVLVSRKAEREGIHLEYKYWERAKDNPVWQKSLKLQVIQAGRLIKKFSSEAVLNFLKNNPYKFSLFPKENIEKIKQEQDIIDRRTKDQVIEVQDAFEYIQPKTHKKSLLGKLNGKKEK